MKCKSLTLFTTGGAGAILLGLLAAGPAYAGSSTGSMEVNAVVAGSCTITASPMSFGTLALSGGDTTLTDASTPVQYSCNTTPTAFTVTTGLSDGLGPVIADYNYAMLNGTNYLSYGLDVYDNSATFNPAHAAVPGTPSSTYNIVGGATPTALTGSYTVAGEIPASQATVVGTYDDTVTFLIAF